MNHKILSIPPHISTSWKNIVSLHITQEGGQKFLIVTLTNHSLIRIPNLDDETIREIFAMHQKAVELESLEALKQSEPMMSPFATLNGSSFPFKMTDMELFSGLLQHSQEHANSPALPQDLLEKVSSISKALGLDEQLEKAPKAEPHCNCPHCQIARALHAESPLQTPKGESTEETIRDDELNFREWDIRELNPQLYEVTNPLDSSEHYQVFLGNPVGCTCGQDHCEHIKAVLNS